MIRRTMNNTVFRHIDNCQKLYVYHRIESHIKASGRTGNCYIKMVVTPPPPLPHTQSLHHEKYYNIIILAQTGIVSMLIA